MNPVATERLAQLRAAAEVGMRMSGFHPHTVQVKPDELAALVEEVHIARAQERPHAGIACRKCGCTDNDCSGCVARIGSPCYWIERDLCSACGDAAPAYRTIEHLAQSVAIRNGSPAAMLMMLDGAGGLHLGCAAVDHPIAANFVELARSLDVAIERGTAGFQSISREKAVELARSCAKAKPQSYYAEPFEPHEWVVDAILQASSSLVPVRAACIHCKSEVAAVEDLDAIRAHSMSCSASPVVQELQRLRRIEEPAYHVAWRWENRDIANIAGTKDEQLDALALAFSGAGCLNCGSAQLPHNVDPQTCRDHGPWGCPDCHWVQGQPIATRAELLARINKLETARSELAEAHRG